MERYFTADFHLGMVDLLKLEEMPFKTIEQHDAALIKSCKDRAKPHDIIYHLGDLASYKQDLSNGGVPKNGLQVKPQELISKIPATFINIRGNHDLTNKVKSVCDSMHIYLSKRYPSVSMSHYPTYDSRIDASCLTSPIHLCGHVHRRWLCCLDLDHNVLNLNVGCMMWKYRIVKDTEVIACLNKIFRRTPQQLYHCKTDKYGKLVFDGDKKIV